MTNLTTLGSRRRVAVSALAQYCVAISGPVALAGSQFVLSLVLLHQMGQAAFGTFSFLLVVSQFLMGLSGALLCAPLAVLVTRQTEELDPALIRSLFATNILFSLFTTLAVLSLNLSLGGGWGDAALFGGFAGVTMLRWFGRAHAYATGQPLRAASSDVASGVALALGTVLVAFSAGHSALLAYASLFASAVIGLLPLGSRFLGEQFRAPRAAEMVRYGEVWKDHSSWSLLGLVTTEATGNAHAYLVTLISGAAAFAAIAASALLIRPSTILMNALGEFERPRLARLISQKRFAEVRRTVALFRAVLCAAWLGTVVLAVVILSTVPRVVFPKQYDISYLAQGAALWLAIMLMRLVRTPESALLQAAGMFRPLALSSLRSAGFSVVAVPVALILGGPLFSLAGVFIGEVAFTIAMWRAAARWRLQAEAAR